MKIHKFTFNPFGEHTYIVWNEQSKKAAIIDPGMMDNSERTAVAKFIENNNLSLQQLFNTHMHVDHAAGNHFIETTYGLQTACSVADNYLAQSLTAQARLFGIPYDEGEISIQTDLADGQLIKVADEECRVLHIAGHTKGHIALYFPTEGIVFSGDALFHMSIGRTDLPGGDYDALINNIENKLLSLPSETIVLTGHGPQTTIGFESRHNPYLAR